MHLDTLIRPTFAISPKIQPSLTGAQGPSFAKASAFAKAAADSSAGWLRALQIMKIATFNVNG
jgi:hypothetical protein